MNNPDGTVHFFSLNIVERMGHSEYHIMVVHNMTLHVGNYRHLKYQISVQMKLKS